MPEKTSVIEQWRVIKRWKQHPEWFTSEAVRQLGVVRSKLLSWKKKYWDMPEPPEEEGRRFRTKGAGRRYKLASYEFQALEFYDRCLREDNVVRYADFLRYLRTIPEFAILNDGIQRSRARRFVERYKPSAKEASEVRAALDDQQRRRRCEAGETTCTRTELVQKEGAEESVAGSGSIENVSALNSEAPVPAIPVITASTRDRAEELDVEFVESNVEFVESDVELEESDVELVELGGMDGGAKEKHVGTNPVRAAVGAGSYNLRCRPDLLVPVHVHQHTDETSTVNVSIPLFAEDIASIKPGAALTSSVIDYFISRYTKPSSGLALPARSIVFTEINFAYIKHSEPVTTVEPVATVPVRLPDFGVKAFKYVLVPVHLNDHWSLSVIQNYSDGKRMYYHVDSMAGGHDKQYIFAVLDWWFSNLHTYTSQGKYEAANAYAYVTKPRQTDVVDCGVYMMHYLYKIKKHIDENKPPSILLHIESLVKGGFSVNKAVAARTSMLKQFTKTV